MQTIEERADRAIYEPTDGHPLKACEVVAFARGYELGAQEQKQIDRIHFKKWYCKKICYKRNKCQSSSIMCYRLGQIVKEIENI